MLVNVQYPDVVLNIKDVKAAIDAGDTVGEVLESNLDELDSNITIKDAKESGIARREKILGIKPLDTSNLEDRRFEVLIRWYDNPMYTETVLRNKLDSVLGYDQYVLKVDIDNKTVSCLIELTRRLMIQSVSNLLEKIIPLDYMIDIRIRYNQHKIFTEKKWTYADMATYTHKQLREEIYLGELHEKLRI